MQKQTPIFEDGKFIGTFTLGNKKPKQSYKDITQRRKRAKQDARLVQLLSK